MHIYAFIDNTRTKSPRHRQIDTNIRTSKKERDQAKIERDQDTQKILTRERALKEVVVMIAVVSSEGALRVVAASRALRVDTQLSTQRLLPPAPEPVMMVAAGGMGRLLS